MAMTDRPTAPGALPDERVDGTALYCRRCDNPRPLGIVAPGRVWSRHRGRTYLFEGGRATLWCERCSCEHTVNLAA